MRRRWRWGLVVIQRRLEVGWELELCMSLSIVLPIGSFDSVLIFSTVLMAIGLLRNRS
jgi:hypothetical protein